MTNMNVSLPEPMRDWIEGQIREGRYGNASEYVRELIRRDQERHQEAELDRKLLQSLDSLDRGKGIEITPEYWERKRRQLQERARRRAKSDGARG